MWMDRIGYGITAMLIMLVLKMVMNKDIFHSKLLFDIFCISWQQQQWYFTARDHYWDCALRKRSFFLNIFSHAKSKLAQSLAIVVKIYWTAEKYMNCLVNQNLGSTVQIHIDGYIDVTTVWNIEIKVLLSISILNFAFWIIFWNINLKRRDWWRGCREW